MAQNPLAWLAPLLALAKCFDLAGGAFMGRGRGGAFVEDAQAAYAKAIEASKGTEQQKAEALIGLGRIASLQNDHDTAAKYYQEASAAAPQSSAGYLSHALVLENQGNYSDALKLLGKAHTLAPDDPAISAVTKETQQRALISEDKEKQARINKLVKELIQTMDQPSRALPSDGWTSVPLTLWMMDFMTQGYSLQEGEDRLLAAGMTDQFIEKSRVQVVERALLDKLRREILEHYEVRFLPMPTQEKPAVSDKESP